MEKKIIPSFYGLRVYLSSILLYFFLVLPFIAFIIFQNVPRFIESRGGAEQMAATMDSMNAVFDTIPAFQEGDVDSLVDMAVRGDLDSLVEHAVRMEEALNRDQVNPDTAEAASGDDILIGPHPEERQGMRMFEQRGPFSRYFTLLFILLAASLLIGLFYNRPFKRFFKIKRRGKEIPPRLLSFCKKQLFRMPLINSLIITMPNIVVIVYSFVFMVSGIDPDLEVERDLFIQLH